MSERPHWLDQPQNHRKLWMLFLLVLAATVLAELVWPIHGHFEIESLPGFHALYGFVACALMIAVAKGLALFLKRPDSYYDNDPDALSGSEAMSGMTGGSVGHGAERGAASTDTPGPMRGGHD